MREHDSIPVNLNDEITARIEGKSEDHFTKVHGYIVFLNNLPSDAEIHDLIRIRITGIKKKFGFGKFLAKTPPPAPKEGVPSSKSLVKVTQ